MPNVPVAIVCGAATVANIATYYLDGDEYQIVKLDIGAASASNQLIAGQRDPENSISIIGASGALFNVNASVLGNVATSVAGHVLVSADGHVLVSGDGTFGVSIVDVSGAVPTSVRNTVDVSSRQIDVSAHGVIIASVQGHALVSGDGIFTIAGNVASDAADAGNPVKIGGVVIVSANPASAAASDRVNASFDKVGRQIVVNQQTRELVVQAVATVESANRTVLGSGGTGIFQDLTHLSLTNAAATAVTVYVYQGSAGTPVLIFNLAAGGGVVNLFQPPWKQTVDDKVWSLQSTSAATGFVYANIQAVLNT